MKRISIYILLTLGLILSGCSEVQQYSFSEAGEGVIKFAVSLPDATRATDDESYDALSHSTLRIYKIEKTSDGNSERLIRKYSPISELPSEVYLVAGEYKVTVAAGDESKASFSHKSYYGEKKFTLKPHQVSETSVVCKVKNIAVEIVFDETVQQTFEKGFKVHVNAADTFSLEDTERSLVPSLTYEKNGIGYFLLPEGTKNISWGFYGQTSDPDVAAKSVKTGVIELPSGGMQYTLKFKYTHDAEGELTVSVKKREYEEIIEDRFNFSPQPVLKGKGFEVTEPVAYTSNPIVFTIDAINALTNVSVEGSGTTYNILSNGEVNQDLATYGISCSMSETGSATITFDTKFFEQQPSGIHKFTFSIEDAGNAKVHAATQIAIPGSLGIMSSNLWFEEAVLGAVVTQENPSGLKIDYRRKGEETWHELGGLTESAEKYIYTVSGKGFNADATYEFKLSENGNVIGKVLEQDSERGIQLPNAGFEDWHQSGDTWYPYGANQEEFWGTGNPGATTLGKEFNVTMSAADSRPGSAGSLSAKLETKKPSVLGIGKLAAGNLMVGAFGEVSGMGGTVKMGRAFDFNARPKELKVWYKYSPQKQDKGRIYICLVNMTNGDTYHIVDTNNPDKTTFSPDDEFLYVDKTNTTTPQGHIIGYGDLMLETTVSTWTEVTIPIKYRDNYSTEKPNVLILTAASSYRGDYFEGEVGSTLYIDDIELVY